MLLLPLMVVVDKLWEQRRRGLLALVAILVLLVISAAVVWAIRWRPVLNGLWRVLTFPFVTSVVLPGISVIAAWNVRWRPVFSALRARRLGRTGADGVAFAEAGRPILALQRRVQAMHRRPVCIHIRWGNSVLRHAATKPARRGSRRAESEYMPM